MKTLAAAFSACALIALSAPAFAAESAAMKHELKANGSPDGAGYSHAAQKGDRGTEDGSAPKIEGRASAGDAVGAKTGGVSNSATGTGATNK